MSALPTVLAFIRRSCMVLLTLAAVTVHAETVVVQATGAGVPVPPGGTDAAWQVVALPTLFTPTTVPYRAFVFSGTGSATLPPEWLGGSNNAGAEGARWIGLRDVPDSLFPSAPVSGTANPPQIPYATIYAYAFNAAGGTVDFDFWGTADNRLRFYVNGTIQSGSMTPSITGGSLIGTEVNGGAGGIGTLKNFTASNVPVTAGTNYLYAVVTDNFISGTGITGGWGDTGLLVSPVPEPASVILAAAGIASAVAVRLHRRRRTRA